jgi:hypothetical protein
MVADFLRIGVLAALLPLVSPSVSAADGQDGQFDEYQVKAAFLFNFAKFVVWPEPPQGAIVIGIVGEDPFRDALDSVVRGKTVNGRSLAVRRFASAEDVSRCHILFVSASEKRRVPELLQRVGHGVLTVGEVPQFVRDGGVIRFLLDGNRVRFQINTQAAEQSGLKIHSQLMSLAAK